MSTHIMTWNFGVFHFLTYIAAKSQCHLLWMTCFNIDCWVITKCANEVFKHEHGKWILFFLQDWTPMTHRWLSHFGACWRIPMVMRGVGLTNFSLFQLAEISRLLTDWSQMFRADCLQNRAWVEIKQQIYLKHVTFKGGERIALSKLWSK